MVFFTSRFVPPPGGKYFFRLGDDAFESYSYEDAVGKTRDILRRHNMSHMPAAAALAEYMCPHMPDGFCTQNYGNKVFTLDRQWEVAQKYYSLPVVAFDEIERRLAICSACPRRNRLFCLSCGGGLQRVKQGFHGARRILPADQFSGTCLCAGTFESVVASIEKDALPEWEETPPPNCWRNQ